MFNSRPRFMRVIFNPAAPFNYLLGQREQKTGLQFVLLLNRFYFDNSAVPLPKAKRKLRGL